MSSFAFGMILIAAGVVAYLHQPCAEAGRMGGYARTQAATRSLNYRPRILPINTDLAFVNSVTIRGLLFPASGNRFPRRRFAMSRRLFTWS